MKVKVIKTTDKKHQGKTFVLEDFTNEEIFRVTGRNFNFRTRKYLANNVVVLQSSNYSAELKIIE